LKHVRALVERGIKQGKHDFEHQRQADQTIKKEERQRALAKAQDIATMKIFAEIEQKRREVEVRKRNYEQRERTQEDHEKEKVRNEQEFEKSWRAEKRLEGRIGNWRDFQSDCRSVGKYEKRLKK